MYSVNIKSPESWDEYFFNMCKTVASNSKCFSRKIGAIIVLDKTIISTGYNGPPRDICQCDERWFIDDDIIELALKGCKTPEHQKEFQHLWHGSDLHQRLKGKCPRYAPELGFKSGEGLEWCVAGHAERNAIVNSAREGLHALKGTKMYMTCGVPCTLCMIEIINAGIDEIISDIRDPFYDQSSKYLLRESNIKIRQYDFIKEI